MPRTDTTYLAWEGMKDRCRNRNRKSWKDYGGRGIKVEFVSFDEFRKEMGDRPLGATLDRIDVNGNYAPGNVRWATRKEQQRNRRDTVYVEVEGVKYLQADLAEKTALNEPRTIAARAQLGLSMAEVLDPKWRHDLSGLKSGAVASAAKRKSLTHCFRGHAFTVENTRRRAADGVRMCRTCIRLMANSRSKIPEIAQDAP